MWWDVLAAGLIVVLAAAVGGRAAYRKFRSPPSCGRWCDSGPGAQAGPACPRLYHLRRDDSLRRR